MNFIDVAVNEAKKSNMNNRYGAIIIHRNKVISTGHNYYTHINTAFLPKTLATSSAPNKSSVLCC